MFSLSSKFVLIEIRGTPRSTRVNAGSRSCAGIAPRPWEILACAGCCCILPGINSSCGAEHRAPPKAELLLMIRGGVQQQPAHARDPQARGAIPAHEREPAYTRMQRGAPRILRISNFDDNELSCLAKELGLFRAWQGILYIG